MQRVGYVTEQRLTLLPNVSYVKSSARVDNLTAFGARR